MKTFKKNLILTLIAVTLLVSQLTYGQGKVTLDFDNAEPALQLVKDYTLGLKEASPAKMSKLLAKDAMVYGLGNGMDSLTVKKHKEYFTNSFSTYQHELSGELYLPVKVTENWNAGEWVLSWGTNTLTHKKTGKKSTVPYHSASLVKDGKIVAIYFYYDLLNIYKTQGYTLTPKGK